MTLAIFLCHTHSTWSKSNKTHFFCYESRLLHVEITFCSSNFNRFSRLKMLVRKIVFFYYCLSKFPISIFSINLLQIFHMDSKSYPFPFMFVFLLIAWLILIEQIFLFYDFVWIFIYLLPLLCDAAQKIYLLSFYL